MQWRGLKDVLLVAVEVDGNKLSLDPTVRTNDLVQNWHYPSTDGNSLNVSWERYNDYHAAPQVNFTASKPTLLHHASSIPPLPRSKMRMAAIHRGQLPECVLGALQQPSCSTQTQLHIK